MPNKDPLAVRASRRIFDEVYARLRTAITTGHFEPGERFVERRLTARLQVSRTPLREALKRLEQEGLVVCYPHRGCFVRVPSYEEARQAYEARRGAEGMSGALAAIRATDSELAAISRLIREGRLGLEAGDREGMLLRNNEFHTLQARAARNVFLEQQLQTLRGYSDLLRGRSWAQSDRAFQAQREHEEIVDALNRRDAASARELNEQHVEAAWKFAEAHLKEREGATEYDAAAASTR
ncbi:MAG: GntR family transcriptional regulator [Acidobacteria bacterium]|nr:GntR family transcriptional regulator [Acidobacteriota bacterium]